MPYHYWNTLTTEDFFSFSPDRTVVVMPVGSIEQHGPHLPVSVDTLIVDGVLKEMLKNVPESYTALVLPTLPVGKANEHIGLNGTLSLSMETVTGLWTDVAESVFRTGLKKLMILNGHGGQSQAASIVARDLRVRHNALVVSVNWWSVRDKPTIFSEEEYTYGIHGGAEETSVMMFLHPELVRTENCRNFVSNAFLQKEKFPRLFSQGILHAWKAEDLHDSGTCGDASIASPEAGQDIVKSAAESLVDLLSEIAAFSLPA